MINEKKTNPLWFVSWKFILLVIFATSLVIQIAGYFTAENFIGSVIFTNTAFYWLAQQWLSHFVPVFATTLILFDLIIIGLIVDQLRFFKKNRQNEVKRIYK